MWYNFIYSVISEDNTEFEVYVWHCLSPVVSSSLVLKLD